MHAWGCSCMQDLQVEVPVQEAGRGWRWRFNGSVFQNLHVEAAMQVAERDLRWNFSMEQCARIGR